MSGESAGGWGGAPTRRGWAVLLALCAALQLVVFSGAFQVQPSCDDLNDGNTLCEYVRGKEAGVAALFRQSAHPANYRPLQSLLAWGAGVAFEPRPLLGLRLLHVLCGWGFIAVGLLWARRLGLGLPGAAVAGLVLATHPALGIMVSSLDGFSSLLAPSLAWLAAWVSAGGGRPRWRLPAAAALLLLGFGVKEYALCGVLLLPWAAFCLAGGARLRRAFAVGALTVALLAAWVWVRTYTIPGAGQHTFERVSLSPLTVARNVAQFFGCLFYWGNTAQLFTEKSRALIAGFGFSLLSTAAALGLHVFAEAFRGRRRVWETAFVAGGVFLGGFPLILGDHVSEMYVAGMLLPFAAWLGMIGDALCRRGPGARALAAAAAALIAACGARVGAGKTRDLAAMGWLAQDQTRQVVALANALPEPPKRMHLLYRQRDIKAQRVYSVFRLNDSIALGGMAVKWFCPDSPRAFELVSHVLPDPEYEAFQAPAGDGSARWDAKARRYR